MIRIKRGIHNFDARYEKVISTAVALAFVFIMNCKLLGICNTIRVWIKYNAHKIESF